MTGIPNERRKGVLNTAPLFTGKIYFTPIRVFYHTFLEMVA